MLYRGNIHLSKQNFCQFYFWILPWLDFDCSTVTWMWSNDDRKIQVVHLYSSHSRGFAIPEPIITDFQLHIYLYLTKKETFLKKTEKVSK